MPRALFAALAFALLSACGGDDSPPAPYKTVPITPFLGEAVMGDPAAPVEVIEYASTTCGHCKAFHDRVLPDLKAKYIDTGKAKLVYRVMPTPPPELSMAGAAIARCAGEAKYFDVIGDLFKSQDSLLSNARQPRGLQQRLIELGGRHGLSADEVGTCVDDEALHEYSMENARSAPPSITSTPSFIVNGKDVDENTLEALSAAIDAASATPAQ
ncbi:MAG: thioredoxin domain-containing protein [Hyphomonadaceae bacterium]|nr:thioredoxin domain-containing protein [Hyphomonadaceae bacterium]